MKVTALVRPWQVSPALVGRTSERRRLEAAATAVSGGVAAPGCGLWVGVHGW